MDCADLEMQLKDIHEKYGQTLSIYIVCVGSTTDELEVWLKVGSKSYKCPNLPDAVDAAYKIGSLFNFRFPVSAKPIWKFLADAVYEVPQKFMHQRIRALNLKLGRVIKKPQQARKKTKETLKRKRTATHVST